MNSQQINKTLREHNRLRKAIGVTSEKLWKTSISSPEFVAMQNKLKDLIEKRDINFPDFKKAFSLLLTAENKE